MKRFFLFLTVGIFVLSFVFVPMQSKAELKGIQISPLSFNLDIPTGGSGSGKIVVTNRNTAELSYVIEVENFAGVNDNGSVMFAGKEPDAVVTSLADWFTFDSPKEGTLAPGKEQEINFTITIPTNAEPGGHYAAVFSRETSSPSAKTSQINVASRVGALVLVSVPGITTKTAALKDFSYPKFVWRGPNELTMKVANTGTIHYDSPATATLKNVFGTTTTVDMGTHTIIPSSERSYVGKWATKYPFGYYKVTASALDGNKNAVTTTGVIWALPLIIVIPLIVLIILIIVLVKYIKKHFKYVAAKNTNSTPPQV